jgi:hypothetical protein
MHFIYGSKVCNVLSDPCNKFQLILNPLISPFYAANNFFFFWCLDVYSFSYDCSVASMDQALQIMFMEQWLNVWVPWYLQF